jgi:hypothetical protein
MQPTASGQQLLEELKLPEVQALLERFALKSTRRRRSE